MAWRDALKESFTLRRTGAETNPAVLGAVIMAAALTPCASLLIALSLLERTGNLDATAGDAAPVEVLSALVARDTASRVLASASFTGRLTLHGRATAGAADTGLIKIPAGASGAADATTGRVLVVPLRPGGGAPVALVARPREVSVLPSATDGRTCIHYSHQYLSRVSAPQTPRYGIGAPCLFILRFGLPSAARAAWLEARDWAPALTFRDGRDAGAGSEIGGVERPGARAAWVATAAVQTLRGPRAAARRSRRCLAGDDASCHEAVFGIAAGPPRDDLEEMRTPGVSAGPFMLAWWIGPDTWHVVERANALRRQFGPARFAQWWTSADTTAAGFEAAFGVPEAEWARYTLRREIALLPMPGFSAWEVLWGFVLVGGGVLALRRIPAPTSAD